MPAASSDALRPARLSEFAGQPAVVRELSIILGAARARDEVPPHLLLSGPPGLGKTTLAGIVAHENGLPLVPTAGPLLEKPGDLVSLLANLSRPSVVFIDEVHRIPKTIEETLYTAMEDGKVDVVIGEGRSTKSLTITIEPFCLIGATTRSGDLGGPFRDRFGHTAKLRPYDHDTLASIVQRSAGLLGLGIEEDAAAMIAARSRGTPRIANHLLKRVRDYAQAQLDSGGSVDATQAGEALEVFGIDDVGLNAGDRELLDVLCRQFNGGPVGAETLATAAGETGATVAEVHEPYLMQLGFLARTPRGRVATKAAYDHLGLPAPAHLTLTDGSRRADGPGALARRGDAGPPPPHRSPIVGEDAEPLPGLG